MKGTKYHIRKDDKVMVTVGKERGKSGKILKVITKKDRVIIEKINMIISLKYHCRLLPIRRHSNASAATTWLAFTIGSTHLFNLHAIKTLNSTFNLRLVRLFIDFKRICSARISEMHTLLCYQRPYYYVMIVHFSTCLVLFCVLIQKRNKCILGE